MRSGPVRIEMAERLHAVGRHDDLITVRRKRGRDRGGRYRRRVRLRGLALRATGFARRLRAHGRARLSTARRKRHLVGLNYLPGEADS